MNSFDFRENEAEVDIDFSNAHLWDDSAVGAVDRVVMKFHQSGIAVNLKGLNSESSNLLDNLAIHSRAESLERVSNL
ncbi:hypothetical protein [Fictibacillus terranigra]|uniref:STAS domain-containing protein n=1 Tax=Fictibacillus terranigra TaxID=3058424 RepID=A0ABT8E849_9BACL|nr:hypothetical protein [Fictibacillus sp. CENA-BCM004]MDN4074077.1 hypothetical protein [Fictibacillus sp. CENA-BCM004]